MGLLAFCRIARFLVCCEASVAAVIELAMSLNLQCPTGQGRRNYSAHSVTFLTVLQLTIDDLNEVIHKGGTSFEPFAIALAWFAKWQRLRSSLSSLGKISKILRAAHTISNEVDSKAADKVDIYKFAWHDLDRKELLVFRDSFSPYYLPTDQVGHGGKSGVLGAGCVRPAPTLDMPSPGVGMGRCGGPTLVWGASHHTSHAVAHRAFCVLPFRAESSMVQVWLIANHPVLGNYLAEARADAENASRSKRSAAPDLSKQTPIFQSRATPAKSADKIHGSWNWLISAV